MKKSNFAKAVKVKAFIIILCLPLVAVGQAKLESRAPYTGDSIPGNPEEGDRIMKNTFKYIGMYRQRNNGDYPSKGNSLVSDIIRNSKYYGFESPNQALNTLANQDDQYNDSSMIRVDPLNKGLPGMFYTRPNGQSVGTAKEKGTKDVLAFTDTYFHFNGVNIKEGRRRPNPVGFYSVLYDDGVVRRISYDREFYTYEVNGPVKGLSYVPAYPDQAGVPHNTLSYEERWDVIFGRKAFPFPPLGYRILEGEQLPSPDNGAAEGALNFLRQRRPDIERGEIWAAMKTLQKKEVSLSELTGVISKLGLPTQVQKLRLESLRQNDLPALLFLPDDGRIVMLSSIDDDYATIRDRGRNFITEIVQLNARLNGQQIEVLTPTNATGGQIIVRVDNTVRRVKLPSLDAEVPQQFVLRNTGATPITLQLEYPLLGVTEAKLSRDVIPPGETATLDLKVKWRSILKAPYQNVLVSIQTNDPIVPRLQLAILLTPPVTADGK